MKKNITFLFLIFTLTVIPQNPSTDSIETKSNQEIKLLTEEINSVKEKLIELKINSEEYNKTLIEKIEFYKVKEDYYAVALSEQATRFALIITGLLALLAFLTFGIFKFEIKQIKKQTEKQLTNQNKKFEEFTNRVNSIDNDLKYSQANIFASIGIYFSGKKDYVSSIKHHLRSAEFNGYYQTQIIENNEIIKNKKKDQYELVLNNLAIANDWLDKITNDTQKKELKGILPILNKSLDSITELDNDNVKLKAAEFRVKMTNITN